MVEWPANKVYGPICDLPVTDNKDICENYQDNQV